LLWGLRFVIERLSSHRRAAFSRCVLHVPSSVVLPTIVLLQPTDRRSRGRVHSRVRRADCVVGVSEHFHLRDFLTYTTVSVRPKSLLPGDDLVDSLELGLATPQRSGVPVRHMCVTSGCRTRQYTLNADDTWGFVR